jgi:predicted metal-dependent HD superfamily phosphohydrolase
MNYHELLRNVEDHVNLFYREHADANMFYHDQSHVLEVLANTKRIADHYQLDDRSFFIVCAAACFHDVGYLVREADLHEEKSAEMAQEYLNEVGVNDVDIEEIKNCIRATKMPQSPKNLNEKIVCDADLFSLGTAEFKEKTQLLKKEKEAVSNSKIDGITWRASSIALLENHTYHTDYCQLLLNKTKAENLEWLNKRQKKKLDKVAKAAEVPVAVNAVAQGQEPVADLVAVEKVFKPKRKDRPDKGIETMFRISSSNSLRMSVMADNKAHIMISVNSIIISVVLGLVVKSLDKNHNLLIPTIILLGVNVATIIYSVLATRPRITAGTFTKQQVDDKSVNLLFFGSFYNMNFKEYDEGIKRMMLDRDFLYGSLTKDVFWQGKVLGRKYKLLRTSYTIFLYGIIAAVLAFSIAVAFFEN